MSFLSYFGKASDGFGSVEVLIFFSGEKTKNLHIFIAFYFEILIHYACVVVFWYNIGLDSGWVWVHIWGIYV